jgi:transposase-like protein
MKKYSEEFKKKDVHLALEGGGSQSRVAHDLGVNVNSLADWTKKSKRQQLGQRPNGKLLSYAQDRAYAS